MIEPSPSSPRWTPSAIPSSTRRSSSSGFVTACSVDDDGTARVRLRLPTLLLCAELRLPDGGRRLRRRRAASTASSAVDIVLEDHFAADEINAGVAARAGFVASFDGLAENELDELRREFLRKAMLAAQDRVAATVARRRRPTRRAGGRCDSATFPPSADRDRLRARRRSSGIPAGDDDPLLVQLDGPR